MKNDDKPNRFQPGNKLGGRPKLPDDLKEIKKLTKDEVERTLAKYARMSPTTFLEAYSKPIKTIDDAATLPEGTTMLDLMVGSVLAKAISEGDQKRVSWLFNWTVGPLERSLSVTNKPYTPTEVNTRNVDRLWERAHAVTGGAALKVVGED